MRLLVIGGVPAFVTLHQALSESSNVRIVALVESNPEAEGSLYAKSNQIPVFQERSQVTIEADAVVDLTETRQLLEAIIDATQDAISVVDENGNGILINRAYTRLTGLSPLDVIGKPATVDIAEGESMHLQVLRTGQPVRGVQMKVGPARREVIVNVAPMRVGGALKGSVGILHDVSEMKKMSDELDHAKQLIRKLEAKYTFDDIIGSSPEMQMALDMARRAAETRATVLLRGESGTGKELFAHAIHNLSDRKYNHFIRVNCAALSESLLESELFGYEEGAFTGARRGGKKGLFEEANGGTILLDEIGELPLNTQAKILRVLQEREIVRVGQAKAIPVDVRIIAATNVNLEKAMANHQFREDLYYRLNVIPIVIPPLRYRTDDIEAIAARLIRKFNQEFGRSVTRIAPAALEYLKSYHWPGNIRELENVIGRAIMNMKFIDSIIERYHLPMLEQLNGTEQLEGTRLTNSETSASQSQLTDYGSGQSFDLSLQEVTDRAEREYIRAVLASTKGNKTEAAKVLGIAVRSLYYKMEKLGLDNLK